MKLLPLTQAKCAVVDDADFDHLLKFTWYYSRPGYARRSAGSVKIYLHHHIMGVRPGKQVDHKNGNTLDNRRSNLRFCVKSQNMANQKLSVRNSSGYKGVRRHRKGWQAIITKNHKTYCLGTFKSPKRASLAYDVAAKKLFKHFARTNAML